MKNYTDLLIEDYTHELVNNWVELAIEPWRYNYLAQKWTCPKNADNRKILSAEDWEKNHQLFLQMGKEVEVYPEAEICATYYNDYGKNYLVWLDFCGPDGQIHTIDAWISENGKNVQNAKKFIDPRSQKCGNILDDIIKTGYLSLDVVKLLPTIGAKTWAGSVENRVQKKLNSYIQENIFEETAKELGIDCKKLDVFGDYLYRGDPGNIADFDITINNNVTRVDLKLLGDSNIADQKVHDAEIVISSSWQDAHVEYIRIKGEPNIEETDLFKNLLNKFSENQKAAGKCFIHIDKIDEETGKVDFAMFGNSRGN